MRRLLKKNSTYPEKLGAILAAVLAGSLLVATTVYAVYSFGLRDLHLGKENVLDISERNSWADDYDDLCRQADVGNFCKSSMGNTGCFFIFSLDKYNKYIIIQLYTTNYNLINSIKRGI